MYVEVEVGSFAEVPPTSFKNTVQVIFYFTDVLTILYINVGEMNDFHYLMMSLMSLLFHTTHTHSVHLVPWLSSSPLTNVLLPP